MRLHLVEKEKTAAVAAAAALSSSRGNSVKTRRHSRTGSSRSVKAAEAEAEARSHSFERYLKGEEQDGGGVGALGAVPSYPELEVLTYCMSLYFIFLFF